MPGIIPGYFFAEKQVFQNGMEKHPPGRLVINKEKRHN
jgi:uncharacterized protein YneF (UPF0154 family)